MAKRKLALQILLCCQLILTQIWAFYQPPDSDGHFRINRKLNAKSFNFTILGDYGGFPSPWYHTPYQTSAAKLLNQVSNLENSQFTLAIGDNFYYHGVKDIYDPAWYHVWDSMYTSSSLQKPWYGILGNHDHMGNRSAQIVYSQFNNRWTIPNFYYTIRYELDGFKVES